jgi:hypothetical protein
MIERVPDPEFEIVASAAHGWRETAGALEWPGGLRDLVDRILWEQFPIVRRSPLRGVDGQESVEVDVPGVDHRRHRVCLIGLVDREGRWTKVVEVFVTPSV